LAATSLLLEPLNCATVVPSRAERVPIDSMVQHVEDGLARLLGVHQDLGHDQQRRCWVWAIISSGLLAWKPFHPTDTNKDKREKPMTPGEMDILASSKAKRDHLSRPARERVAKSIAATDEIRVYLLDPAFEPAGLESFPMPKDYRWEKTGVHGQNTLVGESMTRLRDLWSAILSEVEGLQASCHYPIHGLRFLGGGSVLFETSLCWVCNNYYVVDGVTTVIGYWLGLPGDCPYGPRSPKCRELEEFLTSLLPIPENLVQKVAGGRPRQDYSNLNRRKRPRGSNRPRY
jgi:hypothetical protein